MGVSIKIGLIIQGPIISVGRTGKSYKKFDLSSKDDIISYDCEENINTTITKYGHLFSRIVIATWVGEKKLEHQDAEFIYLDDKIPEQVFTNKNNLIVANNKYRQLLGCYRATEYLRNHQIEYVIRVRTDQLIDLQAICNFLTTNNAFHDNKIYVPFLKEKNLFLLPFLSDFYFAGRLEDLNHFFKSLFLFEHEDIFELIHYDLFFKYAFLTKSHLWGKKLFFPRTNYLTKQQNEITKQIFTDIISPLPRKIYETILWRGEPWNNDNLTTFSKYVYFENLQSLLSNHEQIMSLPSINNLNTWYYCDNSKIERLMKDKAKKGYILILYQKISYWYGLIELRINVKIGKKKIFRWS